VIAVHGIHGDMTTWGMDKSSLKPTDQSWLPLVFENTRIMTFNYETAPDKARWYTSLGVEQEARNLLAGMEQHRHGIESRRTVFVTHDMGGLIVKAVSRTPTIKRQCVNILFSAGSIFVKTLPRGLSSEPSRRIPGPGMASYLQKHRLPADEHMSRSR